MVDKTLIGLVGLALLLDDIKDIGKTDRIHHWQLGATMLFAPRWFEGLF